MEAAADAAGHALTAADVQVPVDVAVVGYDNNRAAWDSPIPITTIAQPGEDMGRVGAELVLEEAQGRSEHLHRTLVLEPSLVVRASTGPSLPRSR